LKINEFYRINSFDSDDRIKFACHELISQWSEVLEAVNDASNDELFYLNVSRGFLTQIFASAYSKDYFTNDHLFTRKILRIGFDLHIILCKIETKSSIIELFTSLLIKLYPNLSSDNDPLQNFTCVLVLNIFWRISYHPQYSQFIYDNEQLMTIIKSTANNENNFVDTFMPRTMKSIQQAAAEILENIDVKN
jgi:hypothetical protein